VHTLVQKYEGEAAEKVTEMVPLPLYLHRIMAPASANPSGNRSPPRSDGRSHSPVVIDIQKYRSIARKEFCKNVVASAGVFEEELLRDSTWREIFKVWYSLEPFCDFLGLHVNRICKMITCDRIGLLKKDSLIPLILSCYH
jgi:hypothetical protein